MGLVNSFAPRCEGWSVVTRLRNSLVLGSNLFGKIMYLQKLKSFSLILFGQLSLDVACTR